MTITTVAAIDSRPAAAGAQQFNAALASMREGVSQTSRAIGRLDSGFSMLRGTMVGYAAVTGARIIARAADDFTLLNTRLTLVTGSGAAAAATLAEINTAAARSHAPASRLADAYTGIAIALREKGRSEKEGISAVETLTKMLAVSGATADETSQAYGIFTRAVVSGRVESQAFFALIEKAPVLMQEFQRQTGLSSRELRRMGELGKISGDTITSVLLNAASRIESRFADVPQTIGGALSNLADDARRELGRAFDTKEAVAAVEALRGAISSPIFRSALAIIGAQLSGAVQTTANAFTFLKDSIGGAYTSSVTAVDQFWFMHELLGNIDGAATRAGLAVSKFSSAFAGFKALAGQKSGAAALGDWKTTTTSMPSTGAKPVRFEESEVEKQAKLLLEAERMRGRLAAARLSNDREGVQAAQEEIAVRTAITKDILAANKSLAGQIEAQIRLNAEIERQAELQAQNRQIGADALATINNGLLEGVKSGERFGDTLRKATASLVEMAARAALLKPLETQFGNLFGSALSSAGFDPAKGLLGAFGFASGTVLNGPATFTASGMRAVAGESGPEAILPLRRGPDGALGIASSGAGAAAPTVVNITITGDATDATVERMRTVARQEFGRARPGVVKDAVSAVGIEHRRDPHYLRR